MITGKTKKKNFFSTLLFWTRDGLKKAHEKATTDLVQPLTDKIGNKFAIMISIKLKELIL